MHTKLTLRMDDVLIRRAKREAKRRGKSVSGMVADFLDSLNQHSPRKRALPPVTRSLLGVIKGKRVSERDYRTHLREKYL